VDASTDQFEAGIGPAISVRVAAPPTADAVFLPTDDAGTPGQLNGEILRQLGLPARLPTATDLKKGYHIQRSAKGLLCYVVTVTGTPPLEALRTNFEQALADPSLASARSIWTPLMGTGAGQIPFAESFAVILNALQASPLIAKRESTAIISLPPLIPPDMREELIEAIHGASARAGSLSAEPDPLRNDPYELPSAGAVIGVLRLASTLERLHRARRYRLSTTLLFFALAESQSASAPQEVRDDLSCEFFSSAVRFLAAERYSLAWRTYFGTDEHLSSLDHEPAILKATDNVATVLRNAHMLAGGAEKIIHIDHLVIALLGLEDARLRRVLAQMAVVPDKLLAEYKDARLGVIATKFNNDVASNEDKLGHSSYAAAIYDFLVHTETPPPLSISIQAPWGEESLLL
jgi:hypothetical protein